MSGHRADANLPAFLADVSEILDSADIDQHLRHRQPQLHGWNQAVPAREYFGFVGMLSKQSDRFIDGLWRQVIKLCWNHFVYSLSSSLSREKTLVFMLRRS